MLSEIDKGEVANRQIKHVNNIGDLELVTKSQLTEELSKLQINSVDLTNYLTTTVADERYAQKQELTSYALSKDVPSINGLVTEEQLKTANSDLKSRVQALEDRPTTASTSYDDSEVNRRLTDLENRPTTTITSYDDSKLVERVKKLEDKPGIDTSHFLTEEILAEKHFISESDVEQTYLKKVDVPTPVNTSKFITDDILTAKNFVTKDELNTLKPNQTLSINNNTLSISGGNSVKLPSSQSEMRGTGMPNGVVEAPIGTTYIDTAKTNGALKWIKTTDGGNTGWKVAEGDTGWILGWQEDTGNNTNRMYFRRKNDVVHVKFNPEIKTSDISGETNLILNLGWDELVSDLSIQGFKPVDDIVQTIYRTSRDIYSSTASMENSEGAQGTGAVIIQYEYYRRDKTGLKLQIVTSDLGVKENHVNPFSYLTEDEWPVQLP